MTRPPSPRLLGRGLKPDKEVIDNRQVTELVTEGWMRTDAWTDTDGQTDGRTDTTHTCDVYMQNTCVFYMHSTYVCVVYHHIY